MMQTKETVIIVHGTWAAPVTDKVRWYQPVEQHSAEQFTNRLDAALRERGSHARCWAHCVDSNQIFHWSGENNWVARTHAAAALGNYVADLQRVGWCCHIVAHSHGGNVVLEALPQITATRDIEGSCSSKIVTLGTPFMDTASPIAKRAKLIRKVQAFGSDVAFAYVTICLATAIPWFFLMVRSERTQREIFQNSNDRALEPPFSAGDWLMLSVLLFPLLITFFLFVYRKLNRRKRGIGQPDIAPVGGPKTILAIGSMMDEAWQVLHHMQNTANPLALQSNIFTYLLSSTCQNISQSIEIARIHGAKSYSDLKTVAKWSLAITHGLTALVLGWMIFGVFAALVLHLQSGTEIPAFVHPMYLLPIVVYVFVIALYAARLLEPTFFSAFLLPFRWSAHIAGSVPSFFTGVATYVVRNRGWPLLCTIAMGLDGYRHKPPSVEQYPSYVESDLVKYENMPIGAQHRALTTRSAWIGRQFGNVTETLANLVITSTDLSLLLRSIESDQSLVHAAYYTDDECIARIADWIAGRE